MKSKNLKSLFLVLVSVLPLFSCDSSANIAKRVTPIDIGLYYYDDNKYCVSWSLLSQTRTYVDSFDVKVEVLQLDESWKLVYEDSVLENKAFQFENYNMYKTYMMYSLNLDNFNNYYGVYRLSVRSQKSDTLYDYSIKTQGSYIEGPSFESPTNLRQDGGLIYWDPPVIPDIKTLYPEGLELPDSEYRTPHELTYNAHIIGFSRESNLEVFNFYTGSGLTEYCDIQKQLSSRKLLSLDYVVTISIVAMRGVVDYVKFSNSLPSITLEVDVSLFSVLD